MTFLKKLNKIIKKNNSLLCIGLDSYERKIPPHLKREKNPIFSFNKLIINKTHDLICAYKLNIAFYQGRGIEGIKQLKMTFDFINTNYPDITTILDAKIGDIDSTNENYVKFVFDYLKADAVTVHPYLGQETLQPFLERTDKGIFVLCRTSNPGAGEFQDLLVDGEPLYLKVARQVVERWNVNGNCMLVVGATYPDELTNVRKIAGEMTFLVPGIGVQGGDVEKTVKAGLNSQKAGLIINSSRGIIFASQGSDFAQRVRDKAMKLRDQINSFR